MNSILVLNAGSSSVKFAIYEQANIDKPLLSGQVENLGEEAHLLIHDHNEVRNVHPSNHEGAIQSILSLVEQSSNIPPIGGIGHRVVHGGNRYSGPIILTPESIEYLESLNNLAPLHQPHNLSMVQSSIAAYPNATQVACFDTAFHHGHPWVNDTFAIPQKYYDEGIRRYGFHGLSYDYVSSQLSTLLPERHNQNVIIAHLGNGASMCALQNKKSIASSMGFSALDGLPMGTRSGSIDAGVLLYWLDKGYSKEKIQHILYKESGLKGLSGMSNDVRSLLDSDAIEAKKALDYFVHRVTREVGALCAILGGLDALVFTGGIGEHAAQIRARVIEPLGFLGLAIDPNKNSQNAQYIHKGRTAICVVPTNEESVIAKAVLREIQS